MLIVWKIAVMVSDGVSLTGMMSSMVTGYEFAVLRDGALCYDSGVTSDVVRGDWTLMDKLKCMVQDLHPDRLAS